MKSPCSQWFLRFCPYLFISPHRLILQRQIPFQHREKFLKYEAEVPLYLSRTLQKQNVASIGKWYPFRKNHSFLSKTIREILLVGNIPDPYANLNLPPLFFFVKEVSQIDPYFPSFNIIVCITTCVKTNQFKSFMKIKTYRVRIT